jgi:uncharacterized phage protein (TIGR02218 family)
MRALKAELAAALASESAKLSLVWRVTRRDGAVLGFTDHDADLTVAGLVCRAASGFLASEVQQQMGAAVDGLEGQAVLSDAAITEAEILAGRYDGARVDIALLDRDHPPAAFAPGELAWLASGFVGEIAADDLGFRWEVRGLSHFLQQTVGDSLQRECIHDLGDARCKIDLAAFTDAATVDEIQGGRVIAAAALTRPAGWYAGGKLTMTGGVAVGLAMEVAQYEPGMLRLVEPLARAPAVGDGFVVAAGCDKRLATCRHKFANVPNYGGFPHQPGSDRWREPVPSRGGGSGGGKF